MRRLRLRPLAVVALTLVVAACGAPAGGAAGTRTASPSPSDTPHPGQIVDEAIRGAVAAPSYQASLTFAERDGKKMLLEVEATVRRTKSPAAMSHDFVRFNAGGDDLPGGLRTVLIGETAYVSVGLLSALTGGGGWIEAELADGEPPERLGFDRFVTLSREFLPLSYARMATGSRNLTSAGVETLDGAKTTRFTGDVEIAYGLDMVPVKNRAELGALLPAGPDLYLKLDLWLDERNMPKKIRFRSGRGVSTKLKIEVSFTAFGGPLTISPPAPGETTPLEDLKG